jgi:hypothetical protein
VLVAIFTTRPIGQGINEMNKLLMSIGMVVLLVAQANAALLATYDFSSAAASYVDPSITASPFATGSTGVSPFTGAAGTLGSGVWNLGSTATSFSEIGYSGFTLTGANFGASAITFTVGGGATGVVQLYSSADGFTNVLGSGSNGTLTVALSGAPTNSLEFRFTFIKLSGGSFSPTLDNISVAQVPEPASMAVFGLLAGGVFGVRRLRRRG